uniref:Uncharacterized protein n=1 Tax=Timema poppense TaxID=170557 RepID=A0A7R9H2N5_TIMPO|nr:unnamed protein product [Timema poppensis]
MQSSSHVDCCGGGFLVVCLVGGRGVLVICGVDVGGQGTTWSDGSGSIEDRLLLWSGHYGLLDHRWCGVVVVIIIVI